MILGKAGAILGIVLVILMFVAGFACSYFNLPLLSWLLTALFVIGSILLKLLPLL